MCAGVVAAKLCVAGVHLHELQSIPDFMASLSFGVLINRFYVGGFLMIDWRVKSFLYKV